ncbi:FAD-dependent oxidoreductase [Corynebacterium suicordis]
MNQPKRVQVLIVGAGPSGLTAAIELLRRKVNVLIVDTKPGPTENTKALLLWRPVLEYLSEINPTYVRENSIATRAFEYWSKDRLETRLNFTMSNHPAILPQNSVENILLKEIHRLGADVSWSTMASNIEVSDTKATVCLNSTAENKNIQPRTVTADWIIGADGDRSLTRQSLGIPYKGKEYPQKFIVSDFSAESTLSKDIGYYHMSGNGTTVVAALPNGRYRLFGALPPLSADGAQPSQVYEDHIRSLCAELPFGTLNPTSFHWTSAFSIHARTATTLVSQRGILVGNSAHCHSPAGGQGLNAGVLDSLSLGWRLAYVIKKDPRESELLKSFEKERLHTAADIVNNTDWQMKIWGLKGAKSNLRRYMLRFLNFSNLLGPLYLNLIDGRRSTGLRRNYPSIKNSESSWRRGNRISNRVIWDSESKCSVSLITFLSDKIEPQKLAVSRKTGAIETLNQSMDGLKTADRRSIVVVRPDLVISHIEDM